MKFFELLKSAQQKFLRPATFLLVLAAAVYPLVSNPTYKYLVLFLLLSAMLRVVFDAEQTINKRLERIELNLGSPNPPSWPNFMAAQETIRTRIVAMLEQGKHVHIEIIGVSARFSWRMIEDHLPPLISKYKNSIISIDIALSSLSTLENWRLSKSINDLNRTVNGLNSFIHDNQIDVKSGRVSVRLYKCDLVPQWHGVLLNKEVLFMGRTEWLFRADDAPDLKVGLCAYRLFELTDRYGGQARIAMFSNWLDRLKARDDELSVQANTQKMPTS